MATIAEVTRILAGLTTVFPSAPELNEANYTMYYRILGDLDASVIDAAALQFAASHTFFPSAGELREAAMVLNEQAQGLPSAEEAWTEVTRSFHTHGYYRGPPEWTHPVIGKAVAALGGYADLCHSENPVADRAHFYRSYNALLSRERQSTRLLPAVQRIVEQLASDHKWVALMEGKGET